MPKDSSHTSSRKRNAPLLKSFFSADSALSKRHELRIILVIFFALTCIILYRLAMLQIVQHAEYAEAAKEYRLLVSEVPAKRGTIYDRNGKVLASSIDATTIYANPMEVEEPMALADALSKALGGEIKTYLEKLTSETTFVFIQRQADVDVAENLRNQDLKGLHFLEDTKRVYPYGKIAGQIVGFVDVDNQGVSGLEYYYDNILAGTPGKRRLEVSADASIPIPDSTREYENAIDGEDIVISIDIEMQAYSEAQLTSYTKKIGGADGSIIIMDASNGEIYAACSLPLFDPENPSESENDATVCKGITQAFEPGSVMKTASMLSIMQTHEATPDTVIACPAKLAVDEYIISDAWERGDASMDLRTILARSSNVGISRATNTYVGKQGLYENLINFGFSSRTGVDYPGETAGFLSDYQDWSQTQFYNISFGQGIQVSPLQLVHFYGMLRNDGVAVKPHFLINKPQTDEDVKPKLTKVVTDKEALNDTINMLESVVTDGTGAQAAIDGITVSGKTGTGEYADPNGKGYVEGIWNLDFVGFLPHSNSSLVGYVGVTKVYGENSVAPLFGDVMGFAADRYRVDE